MPVEDCRLADPEEKTGQSFVAGTEENSGRRVYTDGVREKGSELWSCGRCGMSGMIDWIAAEADREKVPSEPDEGENLEPKRRESEDSHAAHEARRMGHPNLAETDENQNPHFSQRTREVGHPGKIRNLQAHSFPAREIRGEVDENPQFSQNQEELRRQEYFDDDYETERVRRIYRGRTTAMLRRYMRYSIETGRLPSLLGREFFRTQVTSYTVVTFEDRVIFVHDMETCLGRLDEFSRQILARHILQEHDQAATGRLLNCTERTVRTYVPIALDLLTEILLDVGLLERVNSNEKKSCQGGLSG
jgi:hypothetical protein